MFIVLNNQNAMGILEDLIIIIYAITHPHEYVLFTHYFLVLSVTVVPNAVNNISERRRIYVSFFGGGVIHSIIKHSEFISFSIDWFDFFAVQGTLKRLLQHRSLKVSILWCSAFCLVQLSHPYMINGKTIALTIYMTLFQQSYVSAF